MFDTPDLRPLCAAPFVAISIGILINVIGSAVDFLLEKKTGRKPGCWGPRAGAFTIPIILIACIASAALEIGASDPAPWFKPTTYDIVGEWKLAADPTDDLPKPAHMPEPARKLVFYKDGTFLALEIPDLWSYSELSKRNHVSYISGSGTWYLGQVQGTQRLEWVLFTEFCKIDDHADSRTMRYYFQGHLPPYTLATLDSGYRIFHFRRKWCLFIFCNP